MEKESVSRRKFLLKAAGAGGFLALPGIIACGFNVKFTDAKGELITQPDPSQGTPNVLFSNGETCVEVTTESFDEFGNLVETTTSAPILQLGNIQSTVTFDPPTATQGGPGVTRTISQTLPIAQCQ